MLQHFQKLFLTNTFTLDVLYQLYRMVKEVKKPVV